MKRILLALLLACTAASALAAEPVTIRRLVEHYYPYYFKYVGPKEASGEMPMMGSDQFIEWLKVAGDDDAAVQRTLALRNARLEVGSAFDFIFNPLDSKTRMADMANVLEKIRQAAKQFQLHTDEVPKNMTDLWQNPGLEHWSGPYIKPEMLKPFFKRFQFMEINFALASEADGTPPPPCPEPACITWSWLKVEGVPPAYAAALDRWLDTDPTPENGDVRILPRGFMYSLMRTNRY